VLVLCAQHGTARAEEPIQSRWEDLRSGRSADCTAFVEAYLANSDCTRQSIIETWVESRIAQCTTGNVALDGKVITIAGYAHPFELKFKNVKEFLLIPRSRQDCRHPPPPLPDQIISIEFPDGLDVGLDPIWITGILRVRASKNHLAPVSYSLEAIRVAPALIPDVPESG